MASLLIVDDKASTFEHATPDTLSGSIFVLEGAPDDTNIGQVRGRPSFARLIDYINKAAPKELNVLLDVYLDDSISGDARDYIDRLRHDHLYERDHGFAVLQAIYESPRIESGVVVINSSGAERERLIRVINDIQNRQTLEAKRIIVKCPEELRTPNESPKTLRACLNFMQEWYFAEFGKPLENQNLKSFFEFFGSQQNKNRLAWSHEWGLGPSESDALANRFGSLIGIENISMGRLEGLLQLPSNANGVATATASVHQEIVDAFLKFCGVNATFEGYHELTFPRRPGIGYLIALSELVSDMSREGCPPSSVHFKTSEFETSSLTIKFGHCVNQKGIAIHSEFGYLMRLFEKMRKGRSEGLYGGLRGLLLGISTTLSQAKAQLDSRQQGQVMGQAEIMLTSYPALKCFTLEGATSLLRSEPHHCANCHLEKLQILVDCQFAPDGISVSWPSGEI